MNFLVYFGLASLASVAFAVAGASEPTSRISITDVLTAAEKKERWLSALTSVREEVAKHEKFEKVVRTVDAVAGDEEDKQAKAKQPQEYFSGIFQRLADVQHQYEKAQLVLLGFSYTDCSGASDPVHLRKLSVSPDPIPLPGRIVVAASAELAESVAGNLKASVKLEMEIFGHFFEIPCVDGVGSCDYDDLCSSLPKPGQPCPPAFVKAGIPCRCPFPAGKFNLPTSAINLPAVPLPIHSATIRLTAHLTADAKPLTCIQIKARVEKKD